MITQQTYTFHAYSGARQSGKTSRARRQAADLLPLSGIVADPIDVTVADLRAADPTDLDALANAAWLPGVTAETTTDTFGRRIVRVSSTPCVTTLPARG